VDVFAKSLAAGKMVTEIVTLLYIV